MATPLPPSDPHSGLNSARRPPTSTVPSTSVPEESINFDQFDEATASVTAELAAALENPKRGEEQVDALLQQYQSERQSGGRRSIDRLARYLPNGVEAAETKHSAGDGSRGHSQRTPAASSGHASRLPPLTGPTTHVSSMVTQDVDALRNENAELKNIIAELRSVLEANDPHIWEQQRQELELQIQQREKEHQLLQQQCDEWNQKLQTHRLVPADDDLAQLSDELEKERCLITQERRQLDEEKRQVKEDEESLMRQMREMEISMARDRAELARQRTELQRLQNDVQHELELLQRGDATLKERLAQFQRRTQDSSRSTPVISVPQPDPSMTPKPKPPDSTVFKRLFGKG